MLELDDVERASERASNYLREFHFGHVAWCAWLAPHDLFRDKAYEWKDWERQKSWRRHLPEGIVCLQVLAWYWPPVLFVVGTSCLVGVYNDVLYPRGWPNLTERDFTTPFTLTSFALSLLLVFRTTSSYDRWWEARKIWGGLLSIMRDLVRLTMTFSGKDDEHLVDLIARWSIAAPYVLKAHMLEPTDLSEELQHVLTPGELEYLHAAKHRPSAVSQVLSEAVASLSTSDYKVVAINARIAQYQDDVAACERLYRQPIPIAYTRHTSRFMMFWLAFLPFALWFHCQWLTPAVAGVVAFLLMGVENIGIQIEQPFSVLPIGSFCTIIKANTVELMQRHSASKAIVELAGAIVDKASVADTEPPAQPPMDRQPSAKARPCLDRKSSAVSRLSLDLEAGVADETPRVANGGAMSARARSFASRASSFGSTRFSTAAENGF